MSCGPGDLEFAARLDLPPVVEGDTWGGFPFSVEVVTSPGPPPVFGPPTSDLADVVMQFHSSETRLDELLTLTVGGGEIVIDDASLWQFRAVPAVLPLAAGRYFWALRTEAVDGTLWTLVKGFIQVDGKGVVTP